MKKILSIAGSDCSGGAGIQADLKTFVAHKHYGMSVITALTAQNTTGVTGIYEATPSFVGMQLDAVFADIYPDAIKIGMVSNVDIIKVISEKLIQYKAKNIVVDPVMVATSGSKLLKNEAINALTSNLLLLADIITPNIPEAESLCGFPIHSLSDMEKAARYISNNINGAVLIKGGHCDDNYHSNDLLLESNDVHVFYSDRIPNPNTHGTGCTLSSAIACNLADGYDIKHSIEQAKKYITGAIRDGLNLGKGSGPLNHCYNMNISR